MNHWFGASRSGTTRVPHRCSLRRQYLPPNLPAKEVPQGRIHNLSRKRCSSRRNPVFHVLRDALGTSGVADRSPRTCTRPARRRARSVFVANRAAARGRDRGVTRFVEGELHRAGFAGNALHSLGGDWNVASFDTSMTLPDLECRPGDQNPHRWLWRADDAPALSGLRAHCNPKQLRKTVVRILVRGSLIGRDPLGPGLVGVIDEAHAPATRRRQRVVDVVSECG